MKTIANSDIPEIPGVTIESELGRGGMAVVYRGRQSFIDREVAIKVLQTQLQGMDDSLTERFKREARLLAELSHPNIVSCHQAGLSDSGQVYIVMELIDGPNLREYVAKHGAMTPAQSLKVTLAVAEALREAHKHGIIHRDIKPDNVLLRPDTGNPNSEFPFEVKLADLGVARYQKPNDMDLTMEGSAVGTPAYMAPEQFNANATVDFRSDVYGLGCVFFFMLTGQKAYAQRTFSEIVAAKVTQEPPNPRDSGKQIDKHLAELCQRMLAKEREERPDSYDTLTAELSGALMDYSTDHQGATVNLSTYRGANGGRSGGGKSALLGVVALLAVALAATPFVLPMLNGDAPDGDGNGAGGISTGTTQTVGIDGSNGNGANLAGGADTTDSNNNEPPPLTVTPIEGFAEIGRSLIGDSPDTLVEQWTNDGNGLWTPNERPGLINASGRNAMTHLSYPTGPGPWRVTGGITPTKDSHEGGISVDLENGERLKLVLLNLSATYIVSAKRFAPNADGELEEVDRFDFSETIPAIGLDETLRFLAQVNGPQIILGIGDLRHEFQARHPAQSFSLYIDDKGYMIFRDIQIFDPVLGG